MDKDKMKELLMELISKQESKGKKIEQIINGEKFLDAFKISEVNEEGYSESIPAIPKMAFKGGAWEKAVVLKPEYESETTLEECYFELMSKLGYTSSYEMI